jgi:hypothetical protein
VPPWAVDMFDTNRTNESQQEHQHFLAVVVAAAVVLRVQFLDLGKKHCTNDTVFVEIIECKLLL